MQSTTSAGPELPAAIARYFTLQATDPQAVATCFTEEALVVDERLEHRGRKDIAAWIMAAMARYALRADVLAAEGDARRTSVRARVTGTFPGSPIELVHRFELEGDLIARLEIAP